MTDNPAIEPIPINPMHVELLREVGVLVDKYRVDGMPTDSIMGSVCVCMGLLIGYTCPPAIHELAIETCVKNIREGLKK